MEEVIFDDKNYLLNSRLHSKAPEKIRKVKAAEYEFHANYSNFSNLDCFLRLAKQLILKLAVCEDIFGAEAVLHSISESISEIKFDGVKNITINKFGIENVEGESIEWNESRMSVTSPKG